MTNGMVNIDCSGESIHFGFDIFLLLAITLDSGQRCVYNCNLTF